MKWSCFPSLPPKTSALRSLWVTINKWRHMVIIKWGKVVLCYLWSVVCNRISKTHNIGTFDLNLDFLCVFQHIVPGLQSQRFIFRLLSCCSQSLRQQRFGPSTSHPSLRTAAALGHQDRQTAGQQPISAVMWPTCLRPWRKERASLTWGSWLV